MMFGLLPRDTIDYIITITIQLKLLSFHYSVVRMAFSTLFYSVLRVTKHDRHAISDVLTHPPRSLCLGLVVPRGKIPLVVAWMAPPLLPLLFVFAFV